MTVTAIEVFIAASGRRRGRLCRRGDGLFQYVTESFKSPTEEYGSYWIPEYPASGMFGHKEDAVSELLAVLGAATSIGEVIPCSFEIGFGPYPEPVIRSFS